MSAQDDGGPFHYTQGETDCNGNVVSYPRYGASLRDVIAMHALAGMLAREYLPRHEASADAYGYADAMILARKEKAP